jgi:uncharacterized protein
MPVDGRLLAILMCPACRGRVRTDAEEQGVACEDCGRVYPVRDGIPVMLVEEAIPPARPQVRP